MQSNGSQRRTSHRTCSTAQIGSLRKSSAICRGPLELFQHNQFDPEDVNNDGEISPVDALIVINSMKRSSVSDREHFIDVNNDGFRSPLDVLMVINRLSRGGQHSNRHDPPPVDDAPNLFEEVRSFDGTGNNLTDPDQGSTGEDLLRIAEADYADGISSPAGTDRPSAREISNVLSAADVEGTRSDRGLSAFVYVWGQFIDHDIDLSENQTDGESFAIEVPTGDPQFDPTSTGTATIPLTRSEFNAATGTSVDDPRQQVNNVTAYIDGSMVYGSDLVTANSLTGVSKADDF